MVYAVRQGENTVATEAYRGGRCVNQSEFCAINR